MKTLLKFFKNSYGKIFRSIAFYPVLISFACIAMAFVSIGMEDSELIHSVKESVPGLFIEDYETARSILSIFIGGIISLTVFSFSMVMVVLNQSSSNFSPRLLPGLISEGGHQAILGLYVGTLLFCIIGLTTLGARGSEAGSIGLTAMMAALLSVLSIAVFIYFIHSISKAIQIQNIMDSVFKKCRHQLEKELEPYEDSSKGESAFPKETNEVLNSPKSGYFMELDTDLLDHAREEGGLQIEVIPYMNQYVWEGEPLLRLSRPPSDKEKKNLLFCVQISLDRHQNDKGLGELVKLMEIAVKAMSPGINDPGTAVESVQRIGILLGLFLQFPKHRYTKVDNQYAVKEKSVPASELMRLIIQPIRHYGQQDSQVLYALIKALHYLRDHPKLPEFNKEAVSTELAAVREDIEGHLDHSQDRERLLGLL